MIKFSLKIKKPVIYIITILLSILFIWLGHSIATENLTAFDDSGDLKTVKAEVLKVLDTTTTEQELGAATKVTTTVITFSAKALGKDQDEKILLATQTIDTLHSFNRKPVETGDKLLISQSTNSDASSTWTAGEYIRTDSLIILGIIFAVLLLIFGRFKGMNTIISLIFTCLAIFAVFIPAVLSGLNIYIWSIITCIFIIIMTLLIVYGANIKSIAAGIGCFSGIAITGVMTSITSKIFMLTGMIDDDSIYLQYLKPDDPIDLKAIIFASILIGGLGAILDVSISMSSAISEVHEKSNTLTFKELFKSGIAIGRDIMGTMTNTLILAYIGSSLSIALLLIANNASLLALLNREMIVVEILQSLIGSIGILMTIPLTSAVCTAMLTKSSNAIK